MSGARGAKPAVHRDMTKNARARRLVEVRQKQRDVRAAEMAHAELALSEARRRQDAATHVRERADEASRNLGERTSVQELADLSTLRIQALRQLTEARRHFIEAEEVFTTRQRGVQAAEREVRRMERYEERVTDEAEARLRKRERTAMDDLASRQSQSAFQRSA